MSRVAAFNFERDNMSLLLLILILLIVFGGLGGSFYTGGWGAGDYGHGGSLIGVILVVILIVFLLNGHL